MFGQKHVQTNWIIWFQWILLTSISKVVAITGLNMLLSPNWDTFLSGMAFYIFLGVLLFAVGAMIATTQWWILRQYFSGAMRWIVASGAGTVIGTFVAFPLKLRDWYVGPSGFQLDEIAYGVVFGFLVGGAQWLAMRAWVQSAGWWVLSSTIGWTLGMTVGELLPLNWSSNYAGLAYGMITEGIPVVITGITLVMLVRNLLKPATLMDKSAS